MNEELKNKIAILLRNNFNIGKYDKEDFYDIVIDIYNAYSNNKSLLTIEDSVKKHAFINGIVYPLDLKYISKKIEKEFS